MNLTQPCFKVKTRSWNTNVYGLFDNSATPQECKYFDLNISNHTKIYRDDLHDQVYFKVGECQLSPYYRYICQLDCQGQPSNQTCWLRVNQPSPSQNDKKIPYLALYGEDKGSQLRVEDVFKIGIKAFTVITIKTDNNTNSLFDKDSTHFYHLGRVYNIEQSKQPSTNTKKIRKQKKIKKSKSKSKRSRTARQNRTKVIEVPNCKICMFNEQSDTDPLISPCKCNGSCRLIHLDCLKTWVASKINKSIRNGVVRYELSNSSCQICKHPYPRFFINGKDTIHLVDIELPQKPYIFFQGYNLDSENNLNRDFIIIPAQSNKISIGRGIDHEIDILDLTVSRVHAQIYYNDNHFYLRDRNSKFGTLLQLRQDYEFGINQKVRLQVGRCLFEFTPILANNSNRRDDHAEGNQSD